MVSRAVQFSKQYKQAKANLDTLQSTLLEGLCPEFGDHSPVLKVTPHLDLFIKRTGKSGSDYSVGATIDERLIIDEDELVNRLGENRCYYAMIYRSSYFTTSMYAPLGNTVFEYGLLNSPKEKLQHLQSVTSIAYRGITSEVELSHV